MDTAFSCQLSLLIANEQFLLRGVVCSCLSFLEATGTYLSNCLITRISSFIPGRGQALSSLRSAKPHSFYRNIARCLVAVVEERLSTDAPLPALSPEPGSGSAVRKVGCRWFWAEGLLSFCCVSSQNSGVFLPCKEEVCMFVSGQLCTIWAGGKLNVGYKRLKRTCLM